MFCRQFSINLEAELDDDPGQFGGSISSRKCTDLPALIIMLFYLIATITLTIYCIKNSDIDIMLDGYDHCGNICGKNNVKTDSIPYDCFGKNMEEKKFIFIRVDMLGESKECVENCSNGNIVVSEKYCTSNIDLIPFASDLLLGWKYVILSWLSSAILSGAMLTLFVYRINLIPKYVLVILNISLLGVSVASWIGSQYLSNTHYDYMEIIAVAMISTISFVVLLLFAYHMSMKVTLTIQLFREAAEAIIAMPLLLLHPFLTSIIITIIFATGVYGYICVQSFSYLNEYNVKVINLKVYLYEYKPYPIANITTSLLVFGNMWLYEFVRNFQCMIVGGCVAKWFYTKRNFELAQPIRTTISNLLNYHLGTICFGSAILNFIYIVRQLVNSLKEVGNNKESICACLFYYLAETCLSVVLTFVDFISQNGYIMTAIYGYNFCMATIRAFKLIFHNMFNVIIIHAFGNFILISLKISICIISCIIGFCVVHFDANIQKKSMMFIVYGSVSYLTVHCFMAQLEVAIDAILLCFCEDCEFNNGTSKPYYMSSNLAQFVENANKYTDPIKWKVVSDKWQTGPKRV